MWNRFLFIHNISNKNENHKITQVNFISNLKIFSRGVRNLLLASFDRGADFTRHVFFLQK